MPHHRGHSPVRPASGLDGPASRPSARRIWVSVARIRASSGNESVTSVWSPGKSALPCEAALFYLSHSARFGKPQPNVVIRSCWRRKIKPARSEGVQPPDIRKFRQPIDRIHQPCRRAVHQLVLRKAAAAMELRQVLLAAQRARRVGAAIRAPPQCSVVPSFRLYRDRLRRHRVGIRIAVAERRDPRRQRMRQRIAQRVAAEVGKVEPAVLQHLWPRRSPCTAARVLASDPPAEGGRPGARSAAAHSPRRDRHRRPRSRVPPASAIAPSMPPCVARPAGYGLWLNSADPPDPAERRRAPGLQVEFALEQRQVAVRPLRIAARARSPWPARRIATRRGR